MTGANNASSGAGFHRLAANLQHVPRRVAAVLPIRTTLREDHLNDFLKDCDGAEGFEFIDKVLDALNFSYRVVGREAERIPSEGAVLLLVNRPLGLADCAALAKLVGEVRRDVRIVTNGALDAVAALRPLLLPADAVAAALDRGEAVIASGPLRLAPRQSIPLLRVHIGRRHWRFHGLAALLRRGAFLGVRIAEPVASEGKGKLLGFRTEMPIARP